MQEILGRVFEHAMVTEAYYGAERQLMYQLRPVGRELYRSACDLVRSLPVTVEDAILEGHPGTPSINLGPKITTEPKTIQFKHRLYPELDIETETEADIFLIEGGLNIFPDDSRTAVVVWAHFPSLDTPYQLFGFSEDGDTVNPYGRFVTTIEEMREAAMVLNALGANVELPN